MKTSRIMAWVGGLAVVAALVGGGVWWKLYRHPDPSELVRLLPAGGGPVVYVDVARLKASGLLELVAGKAGSEEKEYQEFVKATGFDYREDLTAAAVMLRESDTLVVAKGRFSEAKLAEYAKSHGGRCQLRLCSLQGSSALRQISWMVSLDGMLMMAVGTDPQGARNLGGIANPAGSGWPADPVWLKVPKKELRPGPGLPPGLSTLLGVLADADEATFTVGFEKGQFAIHLLAPCANVKQAVIIAEHLNETTTLFKKLLAREGQKADGADLSGVLAGGEFHAEGMVVQGSWPLSRAYLESLIK